MLSPLAKSALRFLCGASSLFAIAGPAQPAEFVVLPQSTTLVMLGELRHEDVQIFSDYLNSGITDLVLSSPGGSLQAAWEIGGLVEKAELNVVLPDDSDCASACTIVFMHGHHRMMGETARLGFHLPFFASEMSFEQLCRSVEAALLPLVEEQNTRVAGIDPRELEYNASHILIETETEAHQVREQLLDGANFAELAQHRSIGPSGPNGGQLGWFREGIMVPVFEAAVMQLQPGEISEPVHTQFGWHVVLLHEVRRIDGNSDRRPHGTISQQHSSPTPSECYSMAFQMGALEFTRISRLLHKVMTSEGASQRILDLILTTPSAEIAWVSKHEAIEFGLASR